MNSPVLLDRGGSGVAALPNSTFCPMKPSDGYAIQGTVAGVIISGKLWIEASSSTLPPKNPRLSTSHTALLRIEGRFALISFSVVHLNYMGCVASDWQVCLGTMYQIFQV